MTSADHDRLCAEFRAYVEAAGFSIADVGDAEECAADERFTREQRDWFLKFCERWEAAEWTISTQSHGTFLMHGNFCVARLNDHDPMALCQAILNVRRDAARTKESA